MRSGFRAPGRRLGDGAYAPPGSPNGTTVTLGWAALLAFAVAMVAWCPTHDSFETYLVAASAHPSGFMGKISTLAEKLRVAVTAESKYMFIVRVGKHRGRRFLGACGTWVALPLLPDLGRFGQLTTGLHGVTAAFCSDNGSDPHELFALLCIIGWLMVEFAPRRTWPNALCNLSSLRSGRVWTVFTSNLVHANPVHLLNNLIQVLHFGPLIHHTLGCESAITLLACAMLASSFASILWHDIYKGRHGSGSIGASGVGMALVAANAALYPRVVVQMYGVELSAAQVPLVYLLLDAVSLSAGHGG